MRSTQTFCLRKWLFVDEVVVLYPHIVCQSLRGESNTQMLSVRNMAFMYLSIYESYSFPWGVCFVVQGLFTIRCQEWKGWKGVWRFSLSPCLLCYVLIVCSVKLKIVLCLVDVFLFIWNNPPPLLMAEPLVVRSVLLALELGLMVSWLSPRECLQTQIFGQGEASGVAEGW